MEKYGANMALFERLADSQLKLGDQTEFYFFDEIGITVAVEGHQVEGSGGER